MRHREMRLPCDTEVTVHLGGEVRRGRFLNISASGARLAGVGPLPREGQVILSHRGDRVSARVAWCGLSQCGLRFTVRLSQAQVNALRGTTRGSVSWDGTFAFRELT